MLAFTATAADIPQPVLMEGSMQAGKKDKDKAKSGKISSGSSGPETPAKKRPTELPDDALRTISGGGTLRRPDAY